jgi:hypothetical protein
LGKVRGEDSPYSKPAVEQLRNKYRDALPGLEFLTPTNTATCEVERVKAKNMVLQERITKMEQKMDILMELEKRNGGVNLANLLEAELKKLNRLPP